MNRNLPLLALSANAASVAAICGATYLAAYGLDGWGWLIFAALLMHTTVKTRDASNV